MADTLDDIKRRIMALAQKTTDRGCTEAEAFAAMAMVGRLLQSYNLTMDECDVRKSKCVTVHIPIKTKGRAPIDGCINSLAKLFSGRCWFARWHTVNGKRQVSYAFFVQEQDKEALEYLFKVIERAIETEAREFKRSQEYKNPNVPDWMEDLHSRERFSRKIKTKQTRSFQRGMADRVSERLDAMRRENDAAMKAREQSTGTSLMVLKGQLIREEFEKEGIKLRVVRSYRQAYHGGAYGAGQRAGDRVNLNRPLGRQQP